MSILTQSLEMGVNLPLDIRSVVEKSGSIENVEHVFDGHMYYDKNYNSFYGVISSTYGKAKKENCVKMSIPSIDVSGLMSYGKIISGVVWNPYEINFYDSSNGKQWHYTNGSLTTFPYFNEGDQELYVSYVTAVYSETSKNISITSNETMKQISGDGGGGKTITGYTVDPTIVEYGPIAATSTAYTISFTGITHYSDGTSASTIVNTTVTFDANTGTTEVTRTGTTTWNSKTVTWKIKLSAKGKEVTGYTYEVNPTTYTFPNNLPASTTSATFEFTGTTITHYDDGSTESDGGKKYTGETGAFAPNTSTTQTATRNGNYVWKDKSIAWNLILEKAEETPIFYYGKVSSGITGFSKLSNAKITGITNEHIAQAIAVGDMISDTTSSFTGKEINTSFVKLDYLLCLVPSNSNKKFYFYNSLTSQDEEFYYSQGSDYYANGGITITLNDKTYKVYGKYCGSTIESGGNKISLK